MVPADSRRISRAPRYSGVRSPGIRISPTGLSPAAARLSSRFGYPSPFASARILQPRARRRHRPGLGCCAFARHYLRNRCYFLFLRVLRCFSSPRSPRATARCRDRSRRVPPFGHPRINGHLPLPAAFRSLSRPSSPPRATGIPHAPFFAFSVSFARKTCFSCSLESLDSSSLLLATCFRSSSCVLRVPSMSMNSSSP